MTKDYSITMKDSTGRTCEFNINGASIEELVRGGYSLGDAREGVASNTFQNAIADGSIGADAWIVDAPDFGPDGDGPMVIVQANDTLTPARIAVP